MKENNLFLRVYTGISLQEVSGVSIQQNQTKTLEQLLRCTFWGVRDVFFQDHRTPPKFPKKRPPGSFRLPLWERMGLGLRGIGTGLRGRFRGKGDEELYQHLKEKNTKAKVLY